MSTRRRTDAATESNVLTQSARRCCLCYYLDRDLGEKLGQIAHLDQNRANSEEDNLTFLCLYQGDNPVDSALRLARLHFDAEHDNPEEMVTA